MSRKMTSPTISSSSISTGSGKSSGDERRGAPGRARRGRRPGPGGRRPGRGCRGRGRSARPAGRRARRSPRAPSSVRPRVTARSARYRAGRTSDPPPRPRSAAGRCRPPGRPPPGGPSPWGTSGQATAEHERPFADVLRGDRVRDVDELDARGIPRITPFIAATYGPSPPKSVVRVTIEGCKGIESPARSRNSRSGGPRRPMKS